MFLNIKILKIFLNIYDLCRNISAVWTDFKCGGSFLKEEKWFHSWNKHQFWIVEIYQKLRDNLKGQDNSE